MFGTAASIKLYICWLIYFNGYSMSATGMERRHTLNGKAMFWKVWFSWRWRWINEDVDLDEEFSALVEELSSNVSPDEYVGFNAELATAEPGIKTDTQVGDKKLVLNV